MNKSASLHCLSASFAFLTDSILSPLTWGMRSPLPFGFVRFPDKSKKLWQHKFKLKSLHCLSASFAFLTAFGFHRYPSMSSLHCLSASFAFLTWLRWSVARKCALPSPLPFGFVRFPDCAHCFGVAEARASPLPFGFVRFPDEVKAVRNQETAWFCLHCLSASFAFLTAPQRLDETSKG